MLFAVTIFLTFFNDQFCDLAFIELCFTKFCVVFIDHIIEHCVFSEIDEVVRQQNIFPCNITDILLRFCMDFLLTKMMIANKFAVF